MKSESQEEFAGRVGSKTYLELKQNDRDRLRKMIEPLPLYKKNRIWLSFMFEKSIGSSIKEVM